MSPSILISLTEESLEQLKYLIEEAPIKTNRSALIRELIEREYCAVRGIG